MKKFLALLILLSLLLPFSLFAKPQGAGMMPNLPESNPAPEIQVLDTDRGSVETKAKETNIEFQFFYPQNNAILRGKVEIQLQAKLAEKVELYLSHLEGENEIYLGRAEQRGDKWIFEWDTSNTPNGEYKLFAKAWKEDAEFASPSIVIQINNEVQVEEKPEEVKERIMEAQQKVEAIEAEVQETVEEVTEELIDETVSTIEEELPDEQAQKVVEHHQRSKEEIQETVHEMVQTKEKEEQTVREMKETQKKHEEIEKKVSEIIEEMQKMEKLEERIQEKDKKEIVQQKKKETEQMLKEKLEEKEKIEEKLEELQEKQKEIQEKKQELQEKLQEKITQPIQEIGREEIVQEVQKVVQDKLQKLEGDLQRKLEEKIQYQEEMFKDTDNDGISDFQEVKIGTNPALADSDGDGYLDGIEIQLGYNPLNPSPAKRIKYQDPRKVPPKMSEILKVEKVELIEIPEKEEKVLKLEGLGLPNTFVTIFIYSLPIVVVTKTDQYGRWVYILDKPLSPGQHQVYVALTDNQGKIIGRSESFNFAKTGGSIITLIPEVWAKELGIEENITSPYQVLKKTFFLLTLSFIVLGIGIALIIVSILTKRRSRQILSQ